MRKQILVLFLILFVFLTSCATDEPLEDGVYLRAPLEASGDSREQEVAIALVNEEGEVELSFVLEEGLEGKYYLVVNGEDMGKVDLREEPRLFLSADSFQGDEPAQLQLYALNEKDEKQKNKLKHVLQVIARESFPVEKERMRDPLDAAQAFLQWSYSSNSALISTELLSEDAQTFASALRWRHRIINYRREKMNNEKRLISFQILESHVDASEELAFVYIKALEEFVYLDEPDIPAATVFRYFSVLSNEEGMWKVLWTTRHGGGDVETDIGARISVFHIPFLAYGEESVYELEAASYEVKELIELFNEVEYKDFANEYDWEVKNVEKELAEEIRGLPAPPPGLEPIDREAILAYVRENALIRNDEWPDLTFLGGNCQNFVSQAIYAGGIPMREEGSHPWYFYDFEHRSGSWSAVLSMKSSLENPPEKGLSAVRLDTRRDLQIGDIIYIDWDMDGDVDHAMVVTATDPQIRIAGNTEDAFNKRLTDYAGEKYYYHLQGIRP